MVEKKRGREIKMAGNREKCCQKESRDLMYEKSTCAPAKSFAQYTHTHALAKHAPVSMVFFRAAGAVSSCSPAMHARGLNHFPLSEEEPSKHMRNTTARGVGGRRAGEVKLKGEGNHIEP